MPAATSSSHGRRVVLGVPGEQVADLGAVPAPAQERDRVAAHLGGHDAFVQQVASGLLVAEAVAELGGGDQGERAHRRLRAGRAGGRLLEPDDGGAPVAGEVGTEPGDAARPRRAAPREVRSWARRTRAGWSPARAARNAALEVERDGEVVGELGCLQRARRGPARPPRPSRAASASRDRRIRAQNFVVRSAACRGGSVIGSSIPMTAAGRSLKRGELAGELGARPGERRERRVLRQHRDQLVGDLDAGRLPTLHELGEREVRQRDGCLGGQVARPAEPGSPRPRVTLGPVEVAEPVLGDGELGEQDRELRGGGLRRLGRRAPAWRGRLLPGSTPGRAGRASAGRTRAGAGVASVSGSGSVTTRSSQCRAQLIAPIIQRSSATVNHEDGCDVDRRGVLRGRTR